jgi:predicted nucleic acid-binding Zn ribbon protein
MDPIVNITLIGRHGFAWQNAKLWQDANRRAAIFARFWARVQRADAKACWPFDATTVDVEGRPVPVAEFVWFAARGHVARGVFRQRCGLSTCANPAHIERFCAVCGSKLNRKQLKTCSHRCSGVLTLPRDQRGEKNGNFKGWRSKHHILYSRAFKKHNPEKTKAHCAVRYATRTGRLTRPDTCQVCQRECRPHAHHDDYAKRLAVRWLCRKCHRAADLARVAEVGRAAHAFASASIH